MLKASIILAGTVLAGATAASADTVTTLPQVNGTYGQGFAITTTDPTGIRTTVTGPGGGANRASAPAVTGSWFQSSVGGNAQVGITTDYARSGNGSASFASTDADSKADLQYYFSAPVALSSLSSISFDFYRNGTVSAAADPNLAPVMRLDMLRNGSYAGSLIFENVYQNQTPAPTDVWTTLTGNLTSGIFWASNAALGPTFADANGGQKTLQSWINDNAGATLSVFGLSIGVGSGWNAPFSGAVDNVSVAFAGGPSVSSNFEVGATAVPEPATWAMLIGGLGVIGGTIRRRRTGALAAA